ncbi:MAG: hypothetical protein HUJ54_01970 [Erysipelotrichaceae bacterium]|nr:hypothetical protein [Erysipelotrichaceae bacterium]
MEFSRIHPAYAPMRLSWPLSGSWKFRLDMKKNGEEQNWPDSLPDPVTVQVPFVWDQQFGGLLAHGGSSDWWLERDFFIPEILADKQICLHFEDFDHNACIYINGVKTAFHEGSSTHFILPINEILKYGDRNQLTLHILAPLPERRSYVTSYVHEDAGRLPVNTSIIQRGLEGHVWISAAEKTVFEDVILENRDGRIFFDLKIPEGCTVKTTLTGPYGEDLYASAKTSDEISLDDSLFKTARIAAAFQAALYCNGTKCDEYARKLIVAKPSKAA